jgi:hypothetical protein
MLDDEKERKKCLEVVDEARERVDKMVIISEIHFYIDQNQNFFYKCEEKRKKLKRDAAVAASALQVESKSHKKDKKEVEIKIEEDDPDKVIE